jgi:1,4-dihydroxy-2-naphthoyl-CoA hydrolase
MPLCATLGVRQVSADKDTVVLELDWAPELCTSGDLMHGGTIMAVADSAGALCAFMNLPEGAGTATIESKTNFLGGLRSGTLTVASAPLHVGSSTVVVETVARDSGGRLIAKTTQTQAVLKPRSDAS